MVVCGKEGRATRERGGEREKRERERGDLDGKDVNVRSDESEPLSCKDIDLMGREWIGVDAHCTTSHHVRTKNKRSVLTSAPLNPRDTNQYVIFYKFYI